MLTNSTGLVNTAVGVAALQTNSTGTGNVAVGASALISNTTASYNVAVGYEASYNNTTGTENTSIGNNALKLNTTGSYNVVVGHAAGYNVTIGDRNVYVGRSAGEAATTGLYNTGIGMYALLAAQATSGNTAVGYQAGSAVTTGQNNTFIGRDSGNTITTGDGNSILGRYNGNQGGLDIRTSSNNIVLSDGSGNPRVVVTPNGRMGVGYTDPGMGAQINSHQSESNQASIDCRSTSSSFTNMVLLVGSNTNTTNSTYNHIRCDIHGVAQRMAVRDSGNLVNANNSYGSLSDIRLKENIVDASSQWDDIKAVQVRKYNRLGDEQKELGVIAQELEASGMGGLVEEGEYFDAIYNPNEETRKSVKYSVLYMKAIKALQEAMDRIETLEARVAALES